jgi:post-segregation antitoxin (ccd killing protein)
MYVNLYLPDELGKRAKEANLKLSRLLREAVIKELEARDTANQINKQKLLLHFTPDGDD